MTSDLGEPPGRDQDPDAIRAALLRLRPRDRAVVTRICLRLSEITEEAGEGAAEAALDRVLNVLERRPLDG